MSTELVDQLIASTSPEKLHGGYFAIGIFEENLSIGNLNAGHFSPIASVPTRMKASGNSLENLASEFGTFGKYLGLYQGKSMADRYKQATKMPDEFRPYLESRKQML